MLFNSYEFIFAFLPITAAVFFLLVHSPFQRMAAGWLALASLFYYAWWNPAYLPLLLASIGGNYLLGRAIAAAAAWRRALLILGIGLNLAAIGWFKYAGFLAGNLNGLLGTRLDPGDIVLPLAISFFTFQQIAYLVDVYRSEVQERGFVPYVLFVTFFPQLIAGPIVHHGEMMPQFRRTLRFGWDDLAIGASMFALGLFKKVVLADTLARYADPVFAAAADGATIGLLEAWLGALAYTFQLYFDFSGYSDMALGAARIFGIRLPVNFLSPYKATSIIEFWRRWHVTLSRFLRDYLYVPLGGNRHGPRRRYVNLGLTMLLGGLWHGAGWTFVLWGGLHGLYLIVNHLARALLPPLPLPAPLRRGGGWLLTFLAVVVAWVLFRAESLAAAGMMLAAMAGTNGLAVPRQLDLLAEAEPGFEAYLGAGDLTAVLLLAASFVICLALPNVFEWAAAAERRIAAARQAWLEGASWTPLRPSLAHAAAIGALLALTVLSLRRESPFLYFQF